MKNLLAIPVTLLLYACGPGDPIGPGEPVEPGEPAESVEPAELVEAAADLVLLNGGIYTANGNRAWAEAAAVRDGRFIAVGDQAAVQALIGPDTRQVDLDGKMALPSFHDAHVHPMMGGEELLGCGLSEENSVDAIMRKVTDCLESSTAGWLQGYSFDLALFGSNGPHKSLLDEVAPKRPVILWASDGHNAWANSAALRAAGIDAATPDPDLGVIERDPDGSPSGTLRETAQELVRDVIPAASMEHEAAALAAGIAHLNAQGITSFIDAWVGEKDYRAYQAVEREGSLSARVRTCLTYESGFARHRGDDFERVLANRSSYETERVNHDCIKLFLDGVLEGETAALLENYVGFHHRGELILSPADLDAAVTRFDRMGLQVHMHAIGDRAVRAGLDAVQAALESNGASNNRHHVSHLQLIHVDDIERFQGLAVAANFQAAWAYPDEWIMELNLPVVGEERVQAMYPIGSVERAGGRIVGGSDWNVSSADPLYAMEIAVRRQDADAGSGPVLNEKERVSLETMIAAYTINGAWLMHHENETGSIEVGKLADLVILDRNLFDIPPTEIGDARVLETLLEGETVYRPAAKME